MKNQAILFILSIDVSIMIAATGCSRPLQSIEFCHAQARPFERKDLRGRQENPSRGALYTPDRSDATRPMQWRPSAGPPRIARCRCYDVLLRFI